MSPLPYLLYTAAQPRELDRLAIDKHGLSSSIPMERTCCQKVRYRCKLACSTYYVGTSNEYPFFKTRYEYIPVRSAAASLLLTVLKNGYSLFVPR